MRKKSEKFSDKKPALAIAVIVILFVGVPFALEYQKAKEKSQNDYYENWLPDNCNCLERNRSICSNSTFVVEGNFCVNKELKLYTSVVRSCSQYNCSDEMYSFDLEKRRWGQNEFK